jgi:hypothetical protein
LVVNSKTVTVKSSNLIVKVPLKGGPKGKVVVVKANDAEVDRFI